MVQDQSDNVARGTKRANPTLSDSESSIWAVELQPALCDRLEPTDPPVPRLVHGPFVSFAAAVFLVSGTDTMHMWDEAVSACAGVVTSVTQTESCVAPLVVLRTCPESAQWNDLRLSRLPVHAELRFMSVPDRLRVVFHMLQNRRLVSLGHVTALPPALVRMASGLPPSVMPVRIFPDDEGTAATFTSSALLGWVFHPGNVMDWLRKTTAGQTAWRSIPLQTLPPGTLRLSQGHVDAPLHVALLSSVLLVQNNTLHSAMPHLDPRTGSLILKILALTAFCTFSTLFGLLTQEQLGWFDLFVLHLNAIAAGTGDAPAHTDSADGAGATDLDASYAEARLCKRFWNRWRAERQAYETTSRRLWELALLTLHTLRSLDRDNNEIRLPETQRFPFLYAVSALLPGVLQDVRLLAPLLAIHYEQMAPTLLWGLVLPQELRLSEAQQLLLTTHQRRAAAQLMYFVDDADGQNLCCLRWRNVPPRALLRELSALPDDWRHQFLCIGVVEGEFGGTSLDSLMVAPLHRLPLLGLRILLRALATPPETDHARTWLPQDVCWGSALRCAWGWALATVPSPRVAPLVGSWIAHYLAAGWRLERDDPDEDDGDDRDAPPLLWPVFCTARRLCYDPRTDWRVLSSWTRLALCTGATLDFHSTQALSATLARLQDDGHTVTMASHVGLSLARLTRLAESLRRRPRRVKCSSEESVCLARLLLLCPSIDGATLTALHRDASWPIDPSARRLPILNHPRLQHPSRTFANTALNNHQLVNAGTAVFGMLHVRSAMATALPVHNLAQMLVTVGAVLVALEHELRRSPLPWTECQATMQRDWDTRAWAPYAVRSMAGGRHAQEVWFDREWVLPCSSADSPLVSELLPEILNNQPMAQFGRALLPGAEPLPSLDLLSETTREGLVTDASAHVAAAAVAPLLSLTAPRKRAVLQWTEDTAGQSVPPLHVRPEAMPRASGPTGAHAAAEALRPFMFDSASAAADALALVNDPLVTAALQSAVAQAQPVERATDLFTATSVEALTQFTRAPVPPPPVDNSPAAILRRGMAGLWMPNTDEASLDMAQDDARCRELADELVRAIQSDRPDSHRVDDLRKEIADRVVSMMYALDEAEEQ